MKSGYKNKMTTAEKNKVVKRRYQIPKKTGQTITLDQFRGRQDKENA